MDNGLTEEVLREQLAELDFSNVQRGDSIHLWSQQISSNLGYCSLPVIQVTVPLFPNKRGAKEETFCSEEEVIDAIVEKLTDPFDLDIQDDVIAFYSIVTGLLSTDDFDAQDRATLVKRFEAGKPISPLSLLRVGNGDDPVAANLNAIGESKFALHWTN
jgi:hypothetical protein